MLSELGRKGKRIQLPWVPSHCGVVGNEWADEAADRAAKMEQEGIECGFSVVKRRVTKVERRKNWKNERCKVIYGERKVNFEVEDKWSREEVVSMARFRSGHSLELGEYRKRIGLEEEGRCRRCGLEDETTLHVLGCVAGEAQRRMLGVLGPGDVVGMPDLGLAYWRWWRRRRLKPQE